MRAKSKATIEDLYQMPDHGKAEIVDGELIRMSPTGDQPGFASGEIFAHLREYAKRTKLGRAYGDNVGFLVNLPNRRSFSPDAAFYIGKPAGMKFLEGAPVFAVEIRSEGDYGPMAEAEMARKRGDYFAAGTLVVWEVNLLGEEVIKAYAATHPNQPAIYRRGEMASAGQAVPGWSMPVDDLFA